ncbi:hypothetical protein CHS0354_018151 [Potamilus streckersoni]|uniref:Uncharacterized protein n=1 Tax=Potamilus streckersoni TaxID=2493646 RepID=A0AAE0W137_9BIVA|nr:hypothetical protein CHS0354_018151 [Potamilus streckersoni]
MEQYEKMVGKKPKYAKSNMQLPQLLGEIRRVSMRTAFVDIRSFRGFSKTKMSSHKEAKRLMKQYHDDHSEKTEYPVTNERLQGHIENLISEKLTLQIEPRVKIIAEFFIKFLYAVDPEIFSNNSLTTNPLAVIAENDISEVLARLTRKLEWKIEGYTPSNRTLRHYQDDALLREHDQR